MVRDAGTRLQAPKLFLSGRKYNDPTCRVMLARDGYHMTGARKGTGQTPGKPGTVT